MSSLNLPTHRTLQLLDWRLTHVLHIVLILIIVASLSGTLGAHAQDLSFRAAAIYALIFAVLRLGGKRTLAEVTTFDFVLLLIVGEATQQALLGNDQTIAGAAMVVGTLVAIDLALSYAKGWWPVLDALLEGQAVQLIDDGRVLDEHLKQERVEVDDVLETARRTQGIDQLDKIKHAVLERGGQISIVPR